MAKLILIVEDDKEIRDSLKSILELNDYKVETAENGKIGLTKTAQIKPDLILCDVMMPVLDGITLLKKLRESNDITPVIFLTAKAQYQDLRYSMNLGADDYIFKPYKINDLLLSISKRLERNETLSDKYNAQINSLEKTLILMVGHEFKTPMNGIISFTKLIKKKAYELNDTEIEMYCKHLEASTYRLQRNFSKLKTFYDLKLSGIASIGDKNKTDIGKLIAKIAIKVAKEHNRVADLVISDMALAELDFRVEIFSIAIYEILDNAFKFTKKNDLISLKLSIDSSFISIQIIDSGNSANAIELNNLSGRFGQLNRNKNEQQGLGVGLALASLIINSQQGQIYFEDIKPNGVKAEIRLKV